MGHQGWYNKCINNEYNKYKEINIFMANNNISCENEINKGVGYISLNVITGLENIPLPYAYVTIYVEKNDDTEIPIMRLTTTLNPILVQLPVAHSPGTYVRGPEYCFSYYNIRVDALGYYPTRILNIRMFPEIKTNFNINMISVAVENPKQNYENVIVLPPHTKDIMK